MHHTQQQMMRSVCLVEHYNNRCHRNSRLDIFTIGLIDWFLLILATYRSYILIIRERIGSEGLPKSFRYCEYYLQCIIAGNTLLRFTSGIPQLVIKAKKIMEVSLMIGPKLITGA